MFRSKNTSTNSMEGEANPLVKCCLPSNANHGSRYCRDVTNSLKQNLCLNDNNKGIAHALYSSVSLSG